MAFESPNGSGHLSPRLVFAVESRAGARRIEVKRGVAVAGSAVAGLFLLWSVGATAYIAFREDILGGLMSRQTQMQYAYEDRIAALRTSIDRLTSRQLLDQDSFEGKVQELIARQAQLENRQAVVASLATQFEAQAKNSPVETARSGASLPPVLFAPKAQGGPLPAGSSAFAPVDAEKPKPSVEPAPALDAMPLRGTSADARPKAPPADAARTASMFPEAGFLKSGPVQNQLSALGAKLARLDANQLQALSRMEAQARATTTRYQSVISDLGLQPSRFEAFASQGGPLVPVRAGAGAGPFESLAARLQGTLADGARFKRVVDSLPVRRPLKSEMDQTSSFGYRTDPFTRGLALHTGVDLRDEAGAAVRPTARGVVTLADWNGGYGNMVEIDHGAGIVTRYAHLSAILVSEGQEVTPATVIGRVGSTGRSTGPHLHYETRIDGQPVDPVRYLRMAARLGPL
ncbi:membrane protein [Alsobacter metallidurans]|uniref:Membrane protein n=1 Tax=Alsobacter metallidurans TaxID=340221 RepID=A0A917I7V4_9HYPH|nr:peptidoglycan DD-metalloendopeptidase family protein [Alsobacter metallidurans]GGH22350.1 membrane protein [Alsobacter metallidurans]